MILRCTQKLLSVIGSPVLVDPASTPSPEDWYANLLRFGATKSLLMTHSATLFTIFEPNVRAADLRPIGRLAVELIARELAQEGLPLHTFGELVAGDTLLAKTADRSVLGCMNDMALLCEIVVADTGGLESVDVADLNHSLRRNINSARDYRRPIDMTMERARKADQS